MFQRLKLWVLASLAAVAVLVANANAAAACNVLLYQPEVPKSLRKS